MPKGTYPFDEKEIIERFIFIRATITMRGIAYTLVGYPASFLSLPENGVRYGKEESSDCGLA